MLKCKDRYSDLYDKLYAKGEQAWLSLSSQPQCHMRKARNGAVIQVVSFFKHLTSQLYSYKYLLE
ncbi:hypothetical protein RchiOBHm_Chr7g0204091 [Rosa chinensis]|uniref:Uncharacterized protein n=1 Tax=Rosa chinensis TaxID=74649 RepID=A0A2P6P8L8_ROSCH|nr:hypothetical protein RchiOBHm_Chr7g0204091 [Rosa chinensis]